MKLLFVCFLLACTEARRRRSDDAMSSKVDVYAEPSGMSVPFGHVYRDDITKQKTEFDGHDDPLVDLEQLPDKPRRKPYHETNKPAGFANPRDEYLFNNAQIATPKENDTADMPMWFDFPRIQQRNVARHNLNAKKMPKTKQELKYEAEKQRTLEMDSGSLKLFRKHIFEIEGGPEERKKPNWTTCDEFAKGASFHPEDIINIEWVPFFIWSERNLLSVMQKFTIPTIKLVMEYKERYGQNLNMSVNWEVPKLLIKNVMDEILLIAVDRSGLFYGIMKLDFPESLKGREDIKIPTFLVRLKIEDPYLAMMFCDNETPYAALMAVAGQEPATDQEKAAEAATIGFKGIGIPVTRDKRREIEKERADKWLELNKDKRKRIYIHRNYGMFGPETEEKEEDLEQPNKSTA